MRRNTTEGGGTNITNTHNYKEEKNYTKTQREQAKNKE